MGWMANRDRIRYVGNDGHIREGGLEGLGRAGDVVGCGAMGWALVVRTITLVRSRVRVAWVDGGLGVVRGFLRFVRWLLVLPRRGVALLWALVWVSMGPLPVLLL